MFIQVLEIMLYLSIAVGGMVLVASPWAEGSWSLPVRILTTVVGILITALGFTLLLSAEDNKPCAEYQYTSIKGVPYQTCVRTWDPVPNE